MLSNLVVTNQKIVLIVDETNRERIAQKFINQLLHEQGQDAPGLTKILESGPLLRNRSTYELLIRSCIPTGYCQNNNDCNKTPCVNVILPTIADLLSYQRPAFIFNLIKRLSKSPTVKRIFLWASTHNINHEHSEFIIASCEYMADLVVHLETSKELRIITRKPGGGVTNKRYNCEISTTQFLVTPIKESPKGAFSIHGSGGDSAGLPESETVSSEKSATAAADSKGTFKIELDEDEMVARNALKLPYERTSAPTEGNIIYTPDEQDDFDDEDPDEDLCI